MELDGRSLGQIGVTALFDGCILLFDHIVEYVGVHDQSGSLHTRLSAQRTRLRALGEKLSLVAEPHGLRLEYNNPLDREDVRRAVKTNLRLLYLRLQGFSPDFSPVNEQYGSGSRAITPFELHKDLEFLDMMIAPQNGPEEVGTPQSAWTSQERTEYLAKLTSLIGAVEELISNLETIEAEPEIIVKPSVFSRLQPKPIGDNSTDFGDGFVLILPWDIEPSAFRGLDSVAVDGAALDKGNGSDVNSSLAATHDDELDTAAVWGSASESGSDSRVATIDDDTSSASRENQAYDDEDVAFSRPSQGVTLQVSQPTNTYLSTNLVAGEESTGVAIPSGDGDTGRDPPTLPTCTATDTIPSTVSATFSSAFLPSTRPSSTAQSLALDTQHDDKLQAAHLDDIISLPSVDGALASTVHTGPVTMPQRAAAVTYLVNMLNKDDEISALYELAFSKMDTEKFRRNHYRLMLSFVTELTSLKGLSASQEITIRFLQSRTTCDQLSSKIFGSINPNGKTDREKINHLASQDKDALFSLNRFLEAVDEQHATDSLAIPPMDQNLPDIDSGDDEGIEVDDEEIEMENENMFADILPRLEETWTSLFSGPAFDRYKDNLRLFLNPELEPEPQPPLASLSQDHVNQEPPETPGYLYEISNDRPLWTLVTDLCQRQLETLARTQFCWWPLPQPERDLRPGYVRVYSNVVEKGREFYDDIPQSLAVPLFPRLKDSIASSGKVKWTSRNTPAVYLKHTTLMNHLASRKHQAEESSSTKSPPPPGAQKRKGKGKARPSNTSSQQPPPHGHDDQPPQHEVATRERNRQLEENVKGILFLTGDIAANEAVALTFEAGSNDEITIQNLLAAYRRLPSRRWKFATGFKFYRFRSFRNEAVQNFRRITPDKDTERYPEKTHAEYPFYRYMPAPWEEEKDIPCPSGELWLLFKDPKMCGTSSDMTDALPVRNGDPARPRFTAWGIHIERRTHVMVVMIPVWIAFLATVAPTAWFIHSWLVDHPGDLQSATVPIFLGMNLVGFVIQTVLAFVFYGWTRDP